MKTISFKSKSKDKVKVHSIFQERFNRLDSIYKSHGIKIDYSKISTIMPMDSLVRDSLDTSKLEGLYNYITREVHISTDQFDFFLSGKYDEMIMLIMAHEIAHSQGKEHSSDKYSIMYTSSTYIPALLNICTVAELVTDIYIQDYPIYVPEPEPVCPYCKIVH